MSQYSESEGRRQVESLRRRFAHHFLRLLVLAQAEEDRLPQFRVAGPFGELDLANENRIHPLDLSHHRRRDSLDPLAADRKSTRLNSSHVSESRMPSSA